jgi:hypothetical protein
MRTHYCFACLVVATTGIIFLLIKKVVVRVRVPPPQYPSFLYNMMNHQDTPTKGGIHQQQQHQQQHDRHPHQGQLQTKLCVDRCESSLDCVVYKTPWMTCYNGQALFPSDPSWSEWDILDIPLPLPPSTTTMTASIMNGGKDENSSRLPLSSSFQRSFFSTQNASCANEATDIYTLPLNACVGPFGAPRPWGNFTTTACCGTINQNH